MPSPHTLAAWFRQRAKFSKDHPALSFESETLSYAGMQTRIERFAAMLYGLGVRHGDRVACLGFNHPDIVVTLFATARLGAIFLPLNFRLTGPELAFLINDSRVHTLIVDNAHAPVIASIAAEIPCRHIIQASLTPQPWPVLENLLAQADTPAPETAVAAEDIACITYTSGTTGRPKGAMFSHANLWANNINWNLAYGITARDVVLTTAPMFHVSGLFVLLNAVLLAGGHGILHRKFDADAVIAAIAEHQVSMTFAVPTMILSMTQSANFETADFSTLRFIIVGGAPTPESLLRRCAARGIPISHTYGMTEAVSASCYLETELAEARINSVGRSMMLSDIRIAGTDGTSLTAPHEKGEVQLRGENIISGYWERPEANAAAFTEDGWFRSGDVGYLDADGFLYVCDRVKDMIISGGENIYPAEIESVLLEHPAIANAAVVGVEDSHWGERTAAVVVLHPDATLTLEALLTFCGTRLARYKLPRELHIRDELPLNGAGKIVKLTLRQMLAKQSEET